MVDFNNDVTISTPAIDIVRVLVLQRRDNVLNAIEFYLNKINAGVDYGTHSIKSRLYALFLEINSMLQRKLKKEEYIILKNLIQSNNYNDLDMAFQIINECLDRMRLTKLDTGKEIDMTDIEADNKEAGL